MCDKYTSYLTVLDIIFNRVTTGTGKKNAKKNWKSIVAAEASLQDCRK